MTEEHEAEERELSTIDLRIRKEQREREEVYQRAHALLLRFGA